MKNFFRIIANFIFRVRQYNNKKVKAFAQNVSNQKILELGSGKKLKGKYHYSAKQFFNDSNEFIQSDINPNFGHQIVDVTTMDFKEEFDIILCMNVLEHVYDYPKAVENLYNALKTNGQLVVFVPVMYPLHDEPHDYWRFTEHSLRKIFVNFSKIKLEKSGIREFPIAYYLELNK